MFEIDSHRFGLGLRWDGMRSLDSHAGALRVESFGLMPRSGRLYWRVGRCSRHDTPLRVVQKLRDGRDYKLNNTGLTLKYVPLEGRCNPHGVCLRWRWNGYKIRPRYAEWSGEPELGAPRDGRLLTALASADIFVIPGAVILHTRRFKRGVRFSAH